MAKRVMAPTGAERDEMAMWVRQDLNMRHNATMAAIRSNAEKNLGGKLRFSTTMPGFVMSYGRGRWGARCPYPKLANRLCFKHATQLLFECPDLVYCEGFACRRDMGMVTHHAWVLDPQREYAVVDNTWEHPVTGAYLGVPFNKEYVFRTVCRRRLYGVLDNWDESYPLLSGSVEESEFLHPNACEIPADFTVTQEDDLRIQAFLRGELEVAE